MEQTTQRMTNPMTKILLAVLTLAIHERNVGEQLTFYDAGGKVLARPVFDPSSGSTRRSTKPAAR